MVLNAVTRMTSGPLSVVLLFILLLSSFFLMSEATQNSIEFDRLYSLLIAVNILALALLVVLIARNLTRLVRQYRAHAAGSRLTVRLVAMFTVLALAPVSVVYYFSLEFLHRGLDSWFDVRVEKALEDALELGQRSLDYRLRELLRQSRLIAQDLAGVPAATAALRLNEVRRASEASEMLLMTLKGSVIASSSADPADIVPELPGNAVLRQLRQGLDYVGLDPNQQGGLHVRVGVPIPSVDPQTEGRSLHALYPVQPRLNTLAQSVQTAYMEYKELTFLRQPLKYSFTLTLSLILLLSLLTAVWAAFFFARRLVAPIRDLAEGTRAVASGDYDKRLPMPGRDELGFLVGSFNEMTRKIARARDEARRSQQQAEAQRAYLEAVLGHLSSGVLTLDAAAVLRTANPAASQILDTSLQERLGIPLAALAGPAEPLAAFVQTLASQLAEGKREWREEVVLFGSSGRRVVMCHGSALPGDAEEGHVIVLDDVTALVQAQRDAAWGEVARRLAHEIKNPLTPIQLSAERLRRKYLAAMNPADAEILDRATHTIVQQVEAMKEMVRAFSDYARSPRVELRPVSLNRLVTEVLELYQGEPQLHPRTELDPNVPAIEADVSRLRQLLHNLIKNALETGGRGGAVELAVITRCTQKRGCRFVELKVEDNGPGIPEELLEHLFEPYVTTKPKGTGLGLAIVKKIVEEHSGVVWAENQRRGGASITIHLPTQGAAHGAKETA